MYAWPLVSFKIIGISHWKLIGLIFESSTSIVTTSLSCNIYELWQVICRKLSILPTPFAFGSPVGGDY